MQGPSTRHAQPGGSTATARRLLLGARYTECLATLGVQVDVESLALRARALLRLDRPQAVLELFDGYDYSAHPPAAAAELAMLHAIAMSRTLGVGATQTFHRASSLAESAGDEYCLAEIGYYRAHAHWIRRELSDARRCLRAPFAHGGLLRAKAVELEGWLLAAEGKYHEQVEVLQTALSHLDEVEEPDASVEPAILHALAALARDLFLPSVARMVSQRADHIEWTEDQAVTRSQIARTLGWTCALSGDFVGAFRHLRNSTRCAPGDAWRALAELDRAFFARGLEEPRFYEEALDHGLELLDRVDWPSTRGEERAALLLAAELLAPFDAVRAHRYLKVYRTIPSRMSPMLAYCNDDRLRALENYTIGVVARASGDSQVAHELLRSAFSTWNRIGYRWRAVLAALEIYRITRHEYIMEYVRHPLSQFPNSWFAGRVHNERKLFEDPRIASLTPAQRVIFFQAVQGKSRKEIAEAVGKKPNTVRNQLAMIFEKFNVKSQRALIAAWKISDSPAK